ncbi:methyltransferase domain-containing protein [bacterium]|nr:methyltransferase domain-containing protein [bacterium]
MGYEPADIARSFSAVAASYDAWAAAQRQMAERLAVRLPQALADGPIVDLCCGTGALTGLLHSKYPQTPVLGVDVAQGMIDVCRKRFPQLSFEVADVEAFTPEACALIASNCGLHWLTDPAGTVRRLARSLVRGGLLALAVPVEGSLPELRSSYAAAVGEPMAGGHLKSSEHYTGMVEAAGLRIAVDGVEPVRVLYPTATDALRSFHRSGTTFQYRPDYRPLPAKVMRRLVNVYAERFADAKGRAPVTYQALTLVAEKP